MFVQRDWSREEKDDFTLNIQPRLSKYYWATTVSANGKVIGWVLKPAYE
jgi:hypothetical protein